ncbi:MAG: zinc ribbon domain-containing protein [Anaerolineales bacterium]|nr:zinc ribbon domain-containing protein [Anaerolineales bacterium]
MPTYTYRCNNCDYEFEVRQRMSDDPLTDCPECETENSLRKVVNSVGIVFKGSGFYVTDSRGKNGASAPSSNGKSSENGSSANGSSANASDKSEPASSKTEAKTDSKSGTGKGKTEKAAV